MRRRRKLPRSLLSLLLQQRLTPLSQQPNRHLLLSPSQSPSQKRCPL